MSLLSCSISYFARSQDLGVSALYLKACSSGFPSASAVLKRSELSPAPEKYWRS